MHTKSLLGSAAIAGALLASTLGCSRADSTPVASVPDSPPVIAISVVGAAVRTTYNGQCPPSIDRAPAFEAIISVTRGPTTVTYQWLTGKGNSTDPSRRLLNFTGRGAQQAVVRFTETGYVPDSTRADWVAVFVRSPLAVESNHMPFSTSCHTGRPHRYDPDDATNTVVPGPVATS
jgi:eukaryotic-like serine/threonine-protein kinase